MEVMKTQMKPNQLIEEGMALIARGLYRVGDKKMQNRPDIAACDAYAAATVIMELADEFEKLAEEKERQEVAHE